MINVLKSRNSERRTEHSFSGIAGSKPARQVGAEASPATGT
jgi:hypothetical protein